MTIRDYKDGDQDRVRSLCERTFKPPNLTSPLYLAKSVIEENGKIIAFGALRLTSEAIIAIDLSQTLKTRALAFQDLMRTGIYQCQKLGFADMHAFLTGPNQRDFSKVLKKHYGFNGHSSEEILVLEV